MDVELEHGSREPNGASGHMWVNLSGMGERLVLKLADLFLVADVRGTCAADSRENGLYWRGTRFLSTYTFTCECLDVEALDCLVMPLGDCAELTYTNDGKTYGTSYLPQGALQIHRRIALGHRRMADTLTLTNLHSEPITVRLRVQIASDFHDIFEARGFVRTERGTYHEPDVQSDQVVLAYRGRDAIERTTTVAASPAPDAIAGGALLSWDLRIEPRHHHDITLVAQVADTGQESLWVGGSLEGHPMRQREVRIESSSPALDRLLARSLADLRMLTNVTSFGLYPDAGVPWFVCPFGRDALIASVGCLPWFPELTQGTLRLLSAFQGTRLDNFTEEAPGKILHELRQGELANCREIPFVPYYGSVDATPLYLIALGAYEAWTDDSVFLRELWPHALAAGEWIYSHGDIDGDGFIEYHRTLPSGHVNQGWKDSHDGISHADGTLARSPIALCEVQGYAYAAYRVLASLATKLADSDMAALWHARADQLRARFLDHFWWEAEGTCYLALDAEKRPCAVVSSNAGHCLWTGILPEQQARRTRERLLRGDMVSGWGIRTLSSEMVRYNPMSYHNGSVWPHDTAIIGAGYAASGDPRTAWTLLESLCDLSTWHKGARLPELFCGFARRDGVGPTPYTVACSPQAWAAAAPLLLLRAALGIEPDISRGRLVLRAGELPAGLDELTLEGIQLGHESASLQLVRDASGELRCTSDNPGIAVEVVGYTERAMAMAPHAKR